MDNTKNLGVGVMISYLGGNKESVDAFTSAIGKPISGVSVQEESRLRFTFDDGTGIEFYDDGQSCCEHRYMVCENTLPEYVGAKIVSAEVLDAPSVPDEYGEHEVQFLHIQTDKGVITARNHNEHNGYYGGFSVRVRNV